MIVYVESNFILEVAYLQEQHASCEELLGLAESHRIVLAVPAFSVTEARLSIQGRAGRRRAFHEQLRQAVRELSRSKPYQQLSGSTQPLMAALIDSIEEEEQRLESVVARVLCTCKVIPIQATTLHYALGFERRLALSPQDAVIFAAIVEDLANRPAGDKYFLNRNSRDFANPDVYDALKKHDCKMVPSFNDGIALLRGALPAAGSQVPPG